MSRGVRINFNNNQSNTIGVITLEGQFNYGNRLQLFATMKMYESLGYIPVELRRGFGVPLSFSERAGSFYKEHYMRNGAKAIDPNKLSTGNRLAAFQRFGSATCREITKSSDIDCDTFAYFSVGSDQVWNPTLAQVPDRSTSNLVARAYHGRGDALRAKSMLDWYFLGFCQPEQRIALAPSVGNDSLGGQQLELLAKGVQNFKKVSVRENRGAELIRDCAGIEAEVICDPTLTLSAKDWRAVAADGLTPSEPYVFTYLLGGSSKEALEVLDVVTDHGRIPVIPLSDRQKPGEPDAGPAEFIDLIDHATHVVTDSFHAAVFSSILQTPLTITHREGGASMFSRLEQLSEMLGIEEKVYGSPTYDLARAGEYDGVPEAIECEREKFMTYLSGCLNG